MIEWLNNFVDLMLSLAFIGILIAIVAFIAFKSQESQRGGLFMSNKEPYLKIKDISESLYERKKSLTELSEKAEQQSLSKSEKRSLQKAKKAETLEFRKEQAEKPALYVLNLEGDINASCADDLGEIITTILMSKTGKEEVLVRVHSPGGTVDGYGLAASELLRLREAGVKVTVGVDRVAASGGYMASCVANEIIAAPFAYIGSIGVALGMPNFHKLLKKYDVDYESLSVGDRKRNLTLFAENTAEGRKVALEQMERIHKQFIELVSEYRTKADAKKIGTGDVWSASLAKDLGLVDAISTTADWMQSKLDEFRVLELSIEHPVQFWDKFNKSNQMNLWKKISGRLQNPSIQAIEDHLP